MSLTTEDQERLDDLARGAIQAAQQQGKGIFVLSLQAAIWLDETVHKEGQEVWLDAVNRSATLAGIEDPESILLRVGIDLGGGLLMGADEHGRPVLFELPHQESGEQPAA